MGGGSTSVPAAPMADADMEGMDLIEIDAPGPATSATQAVTVTPGVPARLAVSPTSATLPARGSRAFRTTALDAFGNAVETPLAWRARPAGLGRITPDETGGATFTAARLVASGTLSASAATRNGTISASASVAVVPAPMRIGRVDYRRGADGVRIVLSVVDAARRPVSATGLVAVVRLDGRRLLTTRARTGASGKARLRARGRGCFTVSVRRATAAGFRWDGRTPANRFCRS